MDISLANLRIVIFVLYPFSFAEFLLAKELNIRKAWQATPAEKLAVSPLGKKIGQLFEEYLIFGGYPEVVLQKDEETKKTLLKNIYSVLFLREVKDFLALADDYKLRNLKGISESAQSLFLG